MTELADRASRRYVLDASVVVDLLVASDSAELAERIGDGEWHAPALVDYEVVAALRGLVLGRHLTPGRAVDALVDLDQLDLTRWEPDLPSHRRALALRDHCTAYDATYVACAEGVDAVLVTRDQRLGRAAADLLTLLLV